LGEHFDEDSGIFLVFQKAEGKVKRINKCARTFSGVAEGPMRPGEGAVGREDAAVFSQNPHGLLPGTARGCQGVWPWLFHPQKFLHTPAVLTLPPVGHKAVEGSLDAIAVISRVETLQSRMRYSRICLGPGLGSAVCGGSSSKQESSPTKLRACPMLDNLSPLGKVTH